MTTDAKAAKRPTNEEIASSLDRIAGMLEAQQANPYRVSAYREAAETLRHLNEPASVLLDREGITGLLALPNIGESLSHSIEQLILTGKINLLTRLEGEVSPEHVLSTLPGIGAKLAKRIHDQLGIETLPELEKAAQDGRLANVPGFGTGRVRAAREILAGRLRHRTRSTQAVTTAPPADQPPVSELLDVDREYRQKVKARELPKIAPRRFNPTGEAWLPVLHTERGKTHYTALFSNTARAHELGTIRDWVVIYRDDHGGAGQWTVVTSQYGPLQGKRIVRGREAECGTFYASAPPSPATQTEKSAKVASSQWSESSKQRSVTSDQ